MPRLVPLSLIVLTAFILSSCRTPSEKDVKLAKDRKGIGADLMTQGRYREALKELLIAEELNPDDPEIHYIMALVYSHGFKRNAQAREQLDRAIALRKDYSEAENLYGVTFMDEGRYAEAIPHFERALENILYETPSYAEQNLGWSLYKTGKVQRGLGLLEHAVQVNPKQCGAYFWLGIGHAEQGDHAAAAKSLQSFVDTCDKTELSQFVTPAQTAEVLYRLGVAYQITGQTEKARAALEDCRTRFKKSASAAECDKTLSVLPPTPSPAP